MEFTLRNGQTLSFDPTPWMITKNPLLEAWEYNPAFHFDEFGGYEDMYLVSVSGIPLSGTQSTIFWCASKNEMIFFSSKSRQLLPGRLLDYIKLFQSEIIQRYPFQFDLNEMALDLLLREIGVPTD